MSPSFLRIAAVVALALLPSLAARAQLTQIIFQDDFSAASIDPAKYTPDAPFFEGGTGDIHAEIKGGVMQFVGTTTQQWWSGGTLRIAGTYSASEDSPVTISIDRAAEAGVGSASRSALWILDETKTQYVLFADVRGEGGWRFNRKIGEDGDVPTGSGTDIALFNGGNYDDGALHRMSIVADGKTVKLALDGVVGTEVKFPFSKVVFQFGSYARANNDTADTQWDNLRIETKPKLTTVFSDDFASASIDPAKYQADAPFFEGGIGDIHAVAGGGVLRFVGTTTTQWWSGGTLRVVPTFSATESSPVVVSVDRVAEAGVGSASRSALWILDETKTQYVLFADVRGEGGWHYNRKIGEDGDVPTGGGTDITLFNGGTFDDGALHKMGIIADGKTVKLTLDGIVGVEVKFPFAKVVVELGSYARANNDTADTTWDNLKIETIVTGPPPPLFADDFAASSIDPAKYQADAPFFEGGLGDIHAVADAGTMRFIGTTSQQWWSGGTLRIVPTFTASEAETVTLSIDRVAEAGVGSASRSALWILDETKTQYVLFADVRGEGGWHYNRKIGEDGDVPTGGGTDIAAFNGGTYDDGGLHRMSIVANGKTVKLLVDGVEGTEVKFPFSPVVFQFGSYARANNDTADTRWDNLKIESTGAATFGQSDVSLRVGKSSPEITVRIPQGLNSQRAISLQVVSSDATVAVPEGATGSSVTLNFPAGGANTATFRVKGNALGGAIFSIEGGVPAANKLSVAVISGAGVQLAENFTANTIDAAKWQVVMKGFEAGTGTYTVVQKGGVLDIAGNAETDFWSGASLKSAKSYIATKELNLVVTVDRTSIEQVGTAGRTGVILGNADRSKFVFFAQDLGENGWAVNAGSTGTGVNIAAFDALDLDAGKHAMKLVANGSSVEVFLDGISGGVFPLELSSGLYVELGAYARAANDPDYAHGVFDNAQIEYVLPCASIAPAAVTMTLADNSRQATVTIPQLLNDSADVTVTVTSKNPAVAVPGGAASGVLSLKFAAGAQSSQTFAITPVGKGSATFDIVVSGGACVAGSLVVDVVAVPKVLLTDDFAGTSFDAKKWKRDETSFETGTFATDTSSIAVADGVAKFVVTVETALWPGLALFTADTFTAAATTPVTFEVDRVSVGFDLVTGTGAEQRTGVWVRDGSGNFVFFADYIAHDGRNFGWGYNKLTGAPDDNAIGNEVNIGAFDGPKFDAGGKHRIKMVVNGATAKLYLDDIFGAQVPFASASGLTFGFGAYSDETGNVVRGQFDNARILGGEDTSAPAKLSVSTAAGKVVVTWTGAGTLQESDAVATPASWKAVTPAPAGTSYSVSPSGAAKFYRVVR